MVLVAVVVVGWLVFVVFAVVCRLVAVCSVVFLVWGVAVYWPVADSVVVGWLSMLGGGVGERSVVCWASGWLVGRPFAWFGWCVWRVRCRFRIWCVMVAVGCRFKLAVLVVGVSCGIVVGW